MAEIGSWGGKSFIVSPSLVRGFTDLSVKGGSKTDDKVAEQEGYAARKNGEAKTVSLTVQLNASFGVDVREEAMWFVDAASAGKEDFFYLAGKKLMACKLMLTGAEVSETLISPSGAWTQASVKLTLTQSTKDDGRTVASGTGSGNGGSSSGGTKKPKVIPVKTRVPAPQQVGEVEDTRMEAEIVSDDLKNLAGKPVPKPSVPGGVVYKKIKE